MSRSYRRTSISCLCNCDSEKPNKKLWHRRMRAAVLVRLHDADPDEVLLPHENEVGNVWTFGKDGKYWFDPKEYPRLMRK